MYHVNQTDAAISQLWKQLHMMYILFSIFFIHTHTHSHTRTHTHSHTHTHTETPASVSVVLQLRQLCMPPKICRLSACWGAGGAAHTARHEILKQVQKSRTPGGEGGKEAWGRHIYLHTLFAAHHTPLTERLTLISVVWWRADGLQSPASLWTQPARWPRLEEDGRTEFHRKFITERRNLCSCRFSSRTLIT